jgi:toxin ParE1/3/4
VTATHLRPRAELDLVERTRYYRREGGDELGRRFFDAAVAALDAIGRMPGAGTPRVSEVVDVPGLRYRRVAGFPCGWFYFVADDGVDVVRLLADAQNLPAILADTERE